MPSEAFRYELLDNRDNLLQRLDGVTDGGKLDWSAYADVGCSGSIDYTGSDVDQLQHRVRVSHVQDETITPLITALVRVPDSDYDSTGQAAQLDLYDKTLILLEDNFGAAYTVDAGANVVDAVVAIIASTGETKVAIEPSDATLANPIVWEPNTAKLRIVNDLLSAANYWAIRADGLGYLRSTPYTDPSARPVLHQFIDNAAGDYLPAFKRTYDPGSVPNRFVVVGKTDGETEALTAVATDEDPASPFSYPSRGRWITETLTDVDYTGGQPGLTDQANRKLIEARQIGETFDITHPRGSYGLNDVVTFTNRQIGATRRAVIQKQAMRLQVGGLVTSTVRALA